MESLLVKLVLGCYAFAAGAYVFGWVIYGKLRDLITNHYQDRLTALETRLESLETRLK